MRNADLAPYRRRVVALARGRVLEVGIGSGLNLPLYGPEVERVIGLDPSPELLSLAKRQRASPGVAVHLLRASAEAIPVRDAAFDSVVMTWSLCSIDHPLTALAEIRRVLRPEGELLFVEHGLAPAPDVARWQHRLDPLWTPVSCHLDRPVEQLMKQAGFLVVEGHSDYLPTGPRIMTYFYEGRSRAV